MSTHVRSSMYLDHICKVTLSLFAYWVIFAGYFVVYWAFSKLTFSRDIPSGIPSEYQTV